MSDKPKKKPQEKKTLREKVFFFEKIFWGSKETKKEEQQEEVESVDEAKDALDVTIEEGATGGGGTEDWELVSSCESAAEVDFDKCRDEPSLAMEIEKRLAKHREEVQLRIASPVLEWPVLKTPKRSRNPSPQRHASPVPDWPTLRSTPTRSRDTSRPSSPQIDWPVVLKSTPKGSRNSSPSAERRSRFFVSASSKRSRETSVSPVRKAFLKQMTDSSDEVDHVSTVWTDSHATSELRRVDSSESTSSEIMKKSHHIVMQTFETRSEVVKRQRSRTPSRSRHPSCDRILEEERGGGSEEVYLVTSEDVSKKDLQMEATSSVKIEPSSGAGQEVKKFSTKITIRESPAHTAYTKYVISSRSASKDSLLSGTSSTDEGLGKDSLPSWASQKILVEDGDDSVTFHDRFTKYQARMTSMKGIY